MKHLTIMHDIQLCLNESEKITAETIRAVVVLSQMNLHIWHNESNYRKGIKDGNNLELTHGLNGIRNTAKNKIQEIFHDEKLINETGNLSCITIKLPKENTEISGLYYYVLKQIAWEGSLHLGLR